MSLGLWGLIPSEINLSPFLSVSPDAGPSVRLRLSLLDMQVLDLLTVIGGEHELRKPVRVTVNKAARVY
jgi:hypothetical protein